MSNEGSLNGEKAAPRLAEDRETAVVERLETEVIRRLRRRFWVGALMVGVLSYFGVKEIVREVTDSEIRAAQRAAVLAEDKASKAAAATEEATKLSAAYGKTVGGLLQEAVDVQAVFVALRQRLDAESASLKASGEKTRSDAEARLLRLEELVARVAQDTQTSRQAIEAYKKDIEKIKATAAAEARRFVANTAYAVSIQFTTGMKDLAEKAQDVLAKIGFKVATSDVAQAERTAGAGASMTNVSAVPTVNTIRFTEGAALKAQEVRDLLSMLVQFKKLEQQLVQQPTWLGFEKSFLISFGGYAQSGRITVFLVERP